MNGRVDMAPTSFVLKGVISPNHTSVRPLKPFVIGKSVVRAAGSQALTSPDPASGRVATAHHVETRRELANLALAAVGHVYPRLHHFGEDTGDEEEPSRFLKSPHPVLPHRGAERKTRSQVRRGAARPAVDAGTARLFLTRGLSNNGTVSGVSGRVAAIHRSDAAGPQARSAFPRGDLTARPTLSDQARFLVLRQPPGPLEAGDVLQHRLEGPVGVVSQLLAVALLDPGQDGSGLADLVEPGLCGDDEFGAPVAGVGLATHIAELDQLIDDHSDDLLVLAGALGQLGGPSAGGGQERQHGAVPRPHLPVALLGQIREQLFVLDVRPGGAWSSVMVIPGGARIPLSGGYTEVVENERLVMGMNVPGRDEPVLMTLDLAAHGDRTQLTLSQTFDTAEDRDQAEHGSNMLLDSLAAA
jgi:hypothetical protein